MKQNQETMRSSQSSSPIDLSGNRKAALSDILENVLMNATMLYFVAIIAELSTAYS